MIGFLTNGDKDKLCVDRVALSVVDDTLSFDFQFTIENRVDSDVALEKASLAIRNFRDFLIQKDEYAELNDMYNIAERGFIRLGEIPDPAEISHASNEPNKVIQFHDIPKGELKLHSGKIPTLTVYAIDGTPSKGYIFCRSNLQAPSPGFFNYRGEHYFTVTDSFDKFVGNIAVTIAEPGYWVGLNQDTQLARVGDYFATPENMFNMATFRMEGGATIQEYSVIPPRKRRSSAPAIRCTEVPTLYDGDRFDMEIYIPFGFNQHSELVIEPQKLFAEKVNEILISDIKYRLSGGNDWISLKYTPIEYIDRVFEIANEVIASSKRVLSGKDDL